jgi:uncharacterized protein
MVRTPATGELGPPRPDPPPDPPELPEGVDAFPPWPAWYAWAGFAMALSLTLVVVGIVASFFEQGSASFVVVATVCQQAVFVATAIVFARMTTRPRPWQFGLRPTRLRTALAWLAGLLFLYYFVTAIYAAAVQPDVEQEITDDLGADQSTLGLIVAGVMVVGLAPFAEEFFFRGFFFRALRNRHRLWTAAMINGLVFGIVHYDFSTTDALLILPPLGFLGFLFCVLYERTGSIYPCIALHAFNNSLAYGFQADGWAVSGVVFPLVIVLCLLLPRVWPERPAFPRRQLAAGAGPGRL